MFKELIVKYREVILLSIGTLLIILSVSLLLYDKIELVKSEVFADMELKKYNENLVNNNDFDNNIDVDVNQNVDVNTDFIEDDSNLEDENNNSDNNSNGEVLPSREYIGFLEIDKIKLKTGLVSRESYYNNVNRNVEILKVSDYPDVMNGNLILASHSGNSKISYFKHLYQLSLGDIALVYYKDYVYHYKIVDIYNVLKTGSLEIKRDANKTVMTLITCTRNSDTSQTVYILELYSKTRNEG